VSKVAPAGRPVAERVTVPPVLTGEAVTVKLIQFPAVTVWFPGIVNTGGVKDCRLIVRLAETLA